MKIKNKKIIIILAIFSFFIISSNCASAEVAVPDILSVRLPIIFHAIGAILYAVLWLTTKLVWLTATLADFILGITKFTNVAIVKIGWDITRGLCNMVFALILLVMSFSTVLQLNQYGVKKILPRLIGVALLVNFGLVFAGIFIDFAQVITDYFITAARGGQSVSANLMNGLQIAKVYNWNDQSTISFLVNVALGPSLQMIVEQFMAIILFLVAAFTFGAFALFLITRIVKIWFALMTMPLAMTAMIIPGLPGVLGSAWNKWLESFIKWVMFAPIYSFFLYLALYIAQNGIGITTIDSISKGEQPFASAFFQTPSVILQYIILIAILIMGLDIAQTTGAFGAKKAVEMAGNVKKWAGNKAKRPGEWAMDKTKPFLANKTGKLLGLPAESLIARGEKQADKGFLRRKLYGGGLKALGTALQLSSGRMESKSVQLAQKPEDRAQNKAYASSLKYMSEGDRLYEAQNAKGIKKLIAARNLKETGLLAKTNNIAAVSAALQTFQQFGGAKDDKGRTKEENELRETRPDIVVNREERQEIFKKLKEENKLSSLKEIVFNNPDNPNKNAGLNIAKDMQAAFPAPHEFTEAFKGLNKKTKTTVENVMKESLDSEKPENTYKQDNIQARNIFAAVTGKLDIAFKAPENAPPETIQMAKETAKAFVQQMKADQIGNIPPDIDGKESESLKMIGEYATVELLSSIRHELSGRQKNLILNGAETAKNQTVVEFINKSPAWGGKTKKEKLTEQPKIILASQYEDLSKFKK